MVCLVPLRSRRVRVGNFKRNEGYNMDKIIKIKKLPSGSTAILTETASDALGIEVGPGVIFLSADDLPAVIQLLQDMDRYFLGKE